MYEVFQNMENFVESLYLGRRKLCPILERV